MKALLQDIRFAIRQLLKAPGFTATVLLTVALGIGANAAIFTLVNSIMLRKLPVVDPKTLVRIGDDDDCCVNSGSPDNGKYSIFSVEAYLHLKKQLPEFEELAAMQSGFSYVPLTVRRNGPGMLARSRVGEFVSGNYFRTFGLQPAAGRLFMDSDDVKGAPIAAVMSYSAWQHDYAGDAGVVGSTFYVNTKPVTVVGVAPDGFFGDRVTNTPPEFYLPIESMEPINNVPYLHDPDVNWIYMVGRVKPGTGLAALQQKVGGLLRNELAVTKTYKREKSKPILPKIHVVLTPAGGGIQNLQQGAKSTLRLLTGVAAMVLLVACANIANLLLVRSMSRKAEMSIRTALGARRTRIIRQLLTESLVLATAGGLLGLVVAYLGARMLLALAFPDAQNMPIEAAPSLPVMGFAFGLSLLTGGLFGLAPAWVASHAQPADALRTGTRTTGSGASILQRGLVVLQAALSLVLLVCAGLFAKSLYKLQTADMHLDTRNRYIVHINPAAAGYKGSQLEALYRTMEERFHALPGVVKVGISNYTPMEDNNWSSGLQLQGEPDPNKGASFIKANVEYFDSVGTHVVMGRGILPQDSSKAPAVAMVNETFVKQFFKPGTNPIGRRFGNPGPKSSGDYEIVGVVDDTTYTSVQWKDHSMFFVPITQRPASADDPVDRDLSLYAGAIVLATDRPVNDMEKQAAQTLSAINPNLTVVKFQTFTQQIADRFNEERMVSRLTMMFGGLALLLAAIGLYGVTAYGVARRTSEIGIRMALGAARRTVIGMVMRGAMIQAGIGLVIGVPVAIVCVRFVKSQLYEITKMDAPILLGAIGVLAVAACVAGLIPARRAASIDPARALRIE
ncbi:MAG TPA: ABC transporter permease [Terracidiphilus sp.]